MKPVLQKLFVCFVVLVLLVTGLPVLAQDTASKVFYSRPKAMALYNDDQIVIDGRTNDWEKVPAIPLWYQDFKDSDGSQILLSDQGYFKIAWDEEAIYVVLSVPEDKLYLSEANPGRQWFSFALDMEGPCEKMGLALADNRAYSHVVCVSSDNWTPSIQYNWDFGAQSSGKCLGAQPDYSFISRNVTLTKTALIEISFPISEEAKDFLAAENIIGFGAKYEDYMVNHTDDVPSEYRYIWGDTNHRFLDDAFTLGGVRLIDTAISEHDGSSITPDFTVAGERTSAYPTDPSALSETTPTMTIEEYERPSAIALRRESDITIDGILDEWEDVPKNYLWVQTMRSGDEKTMKESDSYFQAMWDNNSLYVSATVYDDNLELIEGVEGRDWFTVGMDFDGPMLTTPSSNILSHPYYYCATLASDGWCPSLNYNWEFHQQFYGGHLTDCVMKLTYDSSNDVVFMEAKFTISAMYKQNFKTDGVLGFGVKYSDNMEYSDDSKPYEYRYSWGDYDQYFYNDYSTLGALLLSKVKPSEYTSDLEFSYFDNLPEDTEPVDTNADNTNKPEDSSTPSSDSDTTATPEPKENDDFPWVVVGIAAAVIVIIVVVAIISKKKKK